MTKLRAVAGKAPAPVIDPIDEAGLESFPASDPPSFVPAHAGPPTPPCLKNGKADRKPR